jgi:hypothetical protein
MIRNVKNSICPYALSIYFINIFFVYYFKGCPACLLRYPLDLGLCVNATTIAVVLSIILYFQSKCGPLLCAREAINGKDFTYI